MSYIQDKLSIEYTGIESYVNQKIKEKSIEWFPKMQFLLFNFKIDKIIRITGNFWTNPILSLLNSKMK